MFEKDADYRKARKESKDRITKVIKVWSAEEETIHDEGFQKGAEFGYNEGFKACAKSRLNITTISDYPIKDEEESKCKTAYIKGIRTMANALKDYDRTDGAWTDYFEHIVDEVLKRLLKENK